ncbi:MAG: DUF6164 family protein [Pseudomonadota bacterium]
MAVQLFKLRNVPDDEAEEIRALLKNNHIDYYETPAGNWGISMPAIWLLEEDQLDRAKALIEEYQRQRFERAKVVREQAKHAGKKESLFAALFANPIQTILYTAFAAVILYFSIKPFLNFGE